MIKSLSINQGKIKSRQYDWIKDVEFFKHNPVVEFTPGLNILFGPNGSGKSTIAGLCAFLMAAEQGGQSAVTQSWLDDLIGFFEKPEPKHLPGRLEHDGQPVLYVDPRKTVGMMGGHFDDDFFAQGMDSIFQAKQSTGQVTASKMNAAMTIIMGDENKSRSTKKGSTRPEFKKPKTGVRARIAASEERRTRHEAKLLFPSEIDWKMNKDHVNNVWAEKLVFAEEILAGNIPIGPRTIILDEPESGFSLLWQAGFWGNVMGSQAARDLQLIVATHSPFALNVPGANYIEMVPGYLEACRKACREGFV